MLLYVHLKNDVFPISLTFPLHQGNTLSLPNAYTSLVNFLTTCKKLWRLSVLGGSSDLKKNYTTTLLLITSTELQLKLRLINIP